MTEAVAIDKAILNPNTISSRPSKRTIQERRAFGYSVVSGDANDKDIVFPNRICRANRRVLTEWLVATHEPEKKVVVRKKVSKARQELIDLSKGIERAKSSRKRLAEKRGARFAGY